MDEDKDVDVSVGMSDLQESTVVNVSESERKSETETQGVESTVEGLSSNVPAGGECASDVKGGGEGNLSVDEVPGCGVLNEEGLRGADDGKDVFADRDSMDVVGDVSGGNLVGEVEREEGETEKSVGGLVHEMPEGDDVVVNDGAHVGGDEARTEGSSVVLSLTGGATKDCVDDAVDLSTKEGLEGGSVKEEESGGEGVRTTGPEDQGCGTENGVSSSAVVSNQNGKIQDVEEVTGDENALDRESLKGAEQSRVTSEVEKDAPQSERVGEDAHQGERVGEVAITIENASGKAGIESAEPMQEMDVGGEVPHQATEDLDNKIQNQGTQAEVIDTSGLSEGSIVQDLVVEEATATVVGDEGLHVNNDDLGNNSEDNKIAMNYADDVRSLKDSVSSNHELSDEQAPATVSEDVTLEGMETDTFDENLSFSLEELQDNIDRFDGSTENHSNMCADTTPSGQPTQVAGNDVAARDIEVNPDSKNDQPLKPEGYLDQGTAHAVGLVASNNEQAMVIDEVVTSELEEKSTRSGNNLDIKTETNWMRNKTDNHDGRKENESVDNREAPNIERYSEIDQHLRCEKSLDNSLASQQMVNDVEQLHSDGGRQIVIVDGSINNHRSDLGLSNDVVVEGEAIKVDNRVSNAGGIALQTTEDTVEGLGLAEEDKAAYANPTEVQDVEMEEQIAGGELDGSDGGQEMEVEEQDSDTEQLRNTEEKFVRSTIGKAGSSVNSHQARYQFPMEDEGEFKVSDLVWGKVRSHPWWPGQIFDPSDASDKALKYHKKDCFLVAYFGDRTFAWVDPSLLKPFYSNFSQVEKQSNSEAFQNAVECALDEVSRRVQLGLACSCVPNDTYDKIKFQMIENAGISQESSVTDDTGSFSSANSFQPNKLVDFMRTLAQCPTSGADKLELVITKAQLLSFYRSKGYEQLPEFQNCGEVVERGADSVNALWKNDEQDKENVEGKRGSRNKRKHNLKDFIYPSKRERHLTDFASSSFDSLDDEEFWSDEKAPSRLVSPSSKKRKAVDSLAEDPSQDGRRTISLAKVSITTPQVPKPSFKIGECIRRAASQMTGSPSIKLKSNIDRFQKFEVDGYDVSRENFDDVEEKKTVYPPEYSSLDDLLSQLHLAAQDPLKGYSFVNTIASFFSDFRNSVIVDRHSTEIVSGKRKRPSHTSGGPETFEFEDMNDTYWTDRVIQNGGEEEPPTGGNDRGDNKASVPTEHVKRGQKTRRSYNRKQHSNANQDATPAKPPGYVDENAPAELVINFSEGESIPSETNLSKMFRRFGPIKESETEVDVETNRARVVFKRCADAEVAQNSAQKFNVFGSMVVNYQLNYSISIPFKASSMALTLSDMQDMQLDIDSFGV